MKSTVNYDTIRDNVDRFRLRLLNKLSS